MQFDAYFKIGWQEPDVLAALGSEQGRNLHGALFKDDTYGGKKLDDSVMIEVPPVGPETRAIILVKSAVLAVPGKGRSAYDVELNLNLFLRSGSRLTNGWSARAKGDDIYEVALGYVDEKAAVQAIWNANLKTGAVNYVNENARLIRWSRDY